VNDSDGYTIIELVVIVFVLSIVFTIAVPSVRNLIDSYYLETFDRIIVSDLRYAQRQSMMNWRETRLYFSSFSDKIYIKQGTKIIKSDPYPAFVKLDYTSFTSNEIKFSCSGNPSIGGSIHISCGKKKHTITVLPVTGRVKIYEFEKH